MSGSFPATFVNNARGFYPDSQIYVTALGICGPGERCYLTASGELVPRHISFNLAQANIVRIPPRFEDARIHLCLGSPMRLPTPDFPFDRYEFTYRHGQIPFSGNTTQVDMFGFPLTARLVQTAVGYDQTVGIVHTGEQVRSQFRAAACPAFEPLLNGHRIIAPRSSPHFKPGGAQANYLQPVIDQTWDHYSRNQFTLIQPRRIFTGRVVNGRLQFTKNGAGPFFLSRPSTKDVMDCSGALGGAGMMTTELELGAEFCAAFNRGVAMNPADWYDAASYYPATTAQNDFARLFHAIGLQGRAYGFARDDVNDQSTRQVLPNADPPTSLTISIGW